MRKRLKKNRKTPINQAEIDRATGRDLVQHGKPDWFGPGDPLTPLAQAQAQGRQWDFPVRQNIVVNPRLQEGLAFSQLRTVADSCDILRLAIETRKDQLVKLDWHIVPIDAEKEPDDRCDALRQFLRKPDGIHRWETWVRMLLEDLFVLDAPSVYVRPTLGGKPFALELIDGATIRPVIDENGRQPVGPTEIAFQQILHGLTACEYTNTEMIYTPRNPRTNKLYGFGPVEQVIMTVNIALRRALHQLQWYTEGNIPEALIGVPEEWNPDQIRQFQDYWDSILEGQTGSRRHAKFVPGAFKMQETKAAALTDKFDEWLARIVCFAFSLSPQPFVAMMNRATAETAHQSALEEGLMPIMQWVKSLHDEVIQERFGFYDLQFEWKIDEVLKPDEKDVIIDRKLRSGRLTLNEARALDGMPPVEGGEKPMIYIGAGAVLLSTVINPPAPAPVQPPGAPPGKQKEPGKEALGKAKKSVPPIDRGRPSVVRQTNKIEKAVGAFLAAQGKDIARQIIDEIGKADDTTKSKVDAIIERLDLSGWGALVGEIDGAMDAITRDGVFAALAQIGVDDAPDAMVTLANEQAVAFANARAAELVGMKWVDDELVPNPNPKWCITDSTREMIRADVTTAMESGMSNDALADLIADNYAFSAQRAEMIARTETAFADFGGNMIAYRASKIVKRKEWIVGAHCCEECQTLRGVVVDIDEHFPNGGGDGPPLHPHCRCDVLPELDEA